MAFWPVYTFPACVAPFSNPWGPYIPDHAYRWKSRTFRSRQSPQFLNHKSYSNASESKLTDFLSQMGSFKCIWGIDPYAVAPQFKVLCNKVGGRRVRWGSGWYNIVHRGFNIWCGNLCTVNMWIISSRIYAHTYTHTAPIPPPPPPPSDFKRRLWAECYHNSCARVVSYPAHLQQFLNVP